MVKGKGIFCNLMNINKAQRFSFGEAETFWCFFPVYRNPKFRFPTEEKNLPTKRESNKPYAALENANIRKIILSDIINRMDISAPIFIILTAAA